MLYLVYICDSSIILPFLAMPYMQHPSEHAGNKPDYPLFTKNLAETAATMNVNLEEICYCRVW